MAQHDLKTLDPLTDDGTLLASELNLWKEAVKSQNAGTTRPAYVEKGMLWVDTSADPELVLYLYSGTVDREIARITVSGQVLAGEQAVIWSGDVPGHDFQPSTVVRFNGSTWVRAVANSEANIGHAIVRAVSGNRVTAQTAGLLQTAVDLGLTPGATYYLSPTTPGAIVATRPTTGVAQTILIATASARAVMVMSRPVAVSGFVKSVPTLYGDNFVRSAAIDVPTMALWRLNGQTAPVLGIVEYDNSRWLGGIDGNGNPFGTMAPASQVPVGSMLWWPGINPPAGWLLLNGQAIPATMPILGSIFGPNVPDWRGRAPLNYAPGLAWASGGGVYGGTLAQANLPPKQFLSSISLAEVANGRFGFQYVEKNSSNSVKEIVQNAFAGSGAGFQTLTPYVVINLIVKHD